MVGGFGKGIKYAMFAANGIIFIGGLVVLSVGIWALVDKSVTKLERLLGSNLYIASASLLIIAGVIISVISFVGSMGAYKEVRCLLFTFFAILFLIFLVLITGSILGYLFRNDIDVRMYQEMKNTLKLYKKDSAITDAWDSVQKNFKCCGISINGQNSSAAYRQLNVLSGATNAVPDSCCRNSATLAQCTSGQRLNERYYADCYEEMKMFLKDQALIIGGIGIGIACLLIIGMTLSCVLFMILKHKNS